MNKPPSADQLARQARMRLAAQEGAAALADVRAKGIAARKNMERLRALRLAKEASDAEAPPAEAPKKKRAAKKKVTAPA